MLLARRIVLVSALGSLPAHGAWRCTTAVDGSRLRCCARHRHAHRASLTPLIGLDRHFHRPSSPPGAGHQVRREPLGAGSPGAALIFIFYSRVYGRFRWDGGAGGSLFMRCPHPANPTQRSGGGAVVQPGSSRPLASLGFEPERHPLAITRAGKPSAPRLEPCARLPRGPRPAPWQI